MMRKHFKKIVILSVFFLLVSGFGIKHAISQKEKPRACIRMEFLTDNTTGITGYIQTENPDPECQSIGYRANPKSKFQTQLVFRNVNYDLSFLWNEEFKGDIPGSVCFPGDGTGWYFDHGMAVVEESEGKAWARWHFLGKAADAEDPAFQSDLQYGVYLYGTFDGGDWPPDVEGEVIYMTLDKWEIFSDGKGKLKKCSCTGNSDEGGRLPFNTVIKFTVVPHECNCEPCPE